MRSWAKGMAASGTARRTASTATQGGPLSPRTPGVAISSKKARDGARPVTSRSRSAAPRM